MAHKKEEMKVTTEQQQLIKNLLQRCGKAEIKDNLWKVPEMVGYYNEAASIPVGPVPTPDEKVLSVKRVVCSPDLPIPGFPGAPTDQQQNVQCQLCSKMFTSKSAYQAHQRTHAKETDDPYTCDICSKTFAVPARLTRHYRTHTGEKPFCCEFCNKSFSVKENLSVHRRIHTKERPYKCDVCSRAFEHSGKLHRHMRIHTGERPHKCTVCSKTFIQSGQLVIHMRTHTGEKPYVCTVCQKGFTCSKQLKVHSRTHTGEKPYSCEICGKSFGYNHVLKLHQVAHYGEKVYKCTICSHTFNSKKCMEAHIKSHSDNAASPINSSASSSESSCSSSSGGSDKENSKDSASVVASILPDNGPTSYESDIHYYLYRRERLSSPYIVPQNYTHPSAGVELLAAAATAAASERAFEEIHRRTPEILYVRTPSYFSAPNMIYDSALNAGDDIRKCVEAALAVEEIASSEEDPLSSPLSSNPVSPAPSVSPDPELSLPPRKRSKRILESMESVKDLSPVRYSSVIQYARAS